MKVHVSINDEDYIAFNIHHYFHSPSLKKNILLGRLAYLLIAVLAILISILNDVNTRILCWSIVFFVPYSIFGFFYYPRRLKKSIRKGIMKMKEEGRLPYDSEATLEFGENEIIETTPNKIKKLPYSDILDVCKTEEYIYIKFGAQEVFILPFRCLEDKDALLDFLDQKLKKSSFA